MKITMRENNSGGQYALSIRDYNNLYNNGWSFELEPLRKASKEFESEDEAIKEFEQITGQDYKLCVCDCCGDNFNFFD